MFKTVPVISPLEELIIQARGNTCFDSEAVEAYMAKIRAQSQPQRDALHPWLSRIVKIPVPTFVMIGIVAAVGLWAFDLVNLIRLIVVPYFVVSSTIFLVALFRYERLCGETQWAEKPLVLDTDLQFDKTMAVLWPATQAENSPFEMVELSHPEAMIRIIVIRAKEGGEECPVHARSVFQA